MHTFCPQPLPPRINPHLNLHTFHNPCFPTSSNYCPPTLLNPHTPRPAALTHFTTLALPHSQTVCLHTFHNPCPPTIPNRLPSLTQSTVIYNRRPHLRSHLQSVRLSLLVEGLQMPQVPTSWAGGWVVAHWACPLEDELWC
jgi:hypothetical protein